MPDSRGLAATERLCRLLSSNTALPTIVLISGGASSLLVRPRPPVSLPDKITVHERLLKSGADIAQINTVRKHLSLVKGGGLLRLTRSRPLATFILSDVVGDDPSVVGSGPTTSDPTTYADARRVLESLGLYGHDAIPDSVRSLVAQGVAGQAPETVKPGEASLQGVDNLIIGSNRTALVAAASEAEGLGYAVAIAPSPISGETETAARAWLGWARSAANAMSAARCCLLSGGETTVTVKGPGRGGRNQEFALAIAPAIAADGWVVLSAGTDGIDGPTDAAGAFVDGSTAARAKAAGVDPEIMRARNDSYGFFDRLGDLFRCGPTGTNVMDIKIAIYQAS